MMFKCWEHPPRWVGLFVAEGDSHAVAFIAMFVYCVDTTMGVFELGAYQSMRKPTAKQPSRSQHKTT